MARLKIPYEPKSGFAAKNKFAIIEKALKEVTNSIVDAFLASVHEAGSLDTWADIGVLQSCLEAGFPVRVSLLKLAKEKVQYLLDNPQYLLTNSGFIKAWSESELLMGSLEKSLVVLDELIGKSGTSHEELQKTVTLKEVLGRETFFDQEWLDKIAAATGKNSNDQIIDEREVLDRLIKFITVDSESLTIEEMKAELIEDGVDVELMLTNVRRILDKRVK